MHDARPPSLAAGALAGLLATYIMDVAGRRIVAPILGKGPSGGLGRWIGHMLKGRFTHDDIAKAAPIPHEAGIGMAAHYAIGLVLGAGYALLLQVSEPRQNSLRRATAYGIATTAFSLVLDVPGTWPGCHGTSRRRSASARVRPVDAHRLRRWARGRTPMQGCDACETVSVSSRIDEAPHRCGGREPEHRSQTQTPGRTSGTFGARRGRSRTAFAITTDRSVGFCRRQSTWRTTHDAR